MSLKIVGGFEDFSISLEAIIVIIHDCLSIKSRSSKILCTKNCFCDVVHQWCSNFISIFLTCSIRF